MPQRPPATITLAGDERSPRARSCFGAMAASKYEFRIRGGYKDLDRLSPGWWVAVIVTQVAGWGALWAVQRLGLHTKDWFAVATSQLASGSLGRVVPGGAAAAAALQYPVLWQAGLSRPAVATRLAAGSILLL